MAHRSHINTKTNQPEIQTNTIKHRQTEVNVYKFFQRSPATASYSRQFATI